MLNLSRERMCANKKRYPSKRQASLALKLLRKNAVKREPKRMKQLAGADPFKENHGKSSSNRRRFTGYIAPYYCPHCDHWHLGHSKKPEVAKIVERPAE